MSIPHERRIIEVENVRRLAVLLADILSEHSEFRFARECGDVSDAAAHVLTTSFDQSDLNQLSASVPGGPDWLNPKAADFDMSRQPWQDEVAALDADLRRAAIALRVIADV